MILCFHHDPKFTDLWDSLLRGYDVSAAYVIGCPPDENTPCWRTALSADDVPGSPRIVFSPQDSPTIPGEIPLQDFEHPPDGVYIFGSDYRHNPLMSYDQCVYLPQRGTVPLWSVQAASVVMYDRWRQRGDC